MNTSDGYSVRDYGRMICDRTRTSALVEALRRAVHPGSVLLDIGTGTGFFALLACQLGAARVYAIEPGDAIEVAKLCAERIAGADRIVWLQGVSTEITLPEKVDVVIGDLRGTLPLYTMNVAAFIDARRRHLKSGGQMIPLRDVVRAVPAQAAAEYASVSSPWEKNEYGLDLGAGRVFVANSRWRARSEPAAAADLLSSPGSWGEIDYRRTESPNLDGDLDWRIERPGTLHGLYVWFDSEVAEGIGYSNAPDLPELIYGRAFFPFLEATDVQVGDRVATRMSAALVDGEYVFRWNTRVTDAAGTVKGDFRQSTFYSRPLSRERLQHIASDYVPTLNLDGQIDHTVMQAMAQGQPLGAIAENLAARYPQRFASSAAALKHVGKLSAKYTGSVDLAAGLRVTGTSPSREDSPS
jgi:type I protein arginine methyltransferase